MKLIAKIKMKRDVKKKETNVSSNTITDVITKTYTHASPVISIQKSYFTLLHSTPIPSLIINRHTISDLSNHAEIKYELFPSLGLHQSHWEPVSYGYADI